MFYALSKTLDLFLAPLTWAIAAMLVAAWGIRRGKRRVAWGASLTAPLLLYAFANAPVANGIVRALESSAKSTVDDAVIYDAVIVLGGIVDTNAPPSALAAPELNAAADRLVAAFELLRRGRAKNAVVTSDPVEAPALARQLEAWGIAKERIAVDGESWNTHDNAVNAARIVRERGYARVVLVTSAMHMKRASGCFRKEGIVVDTLPVDFQAYDSGRARGSLLPRAESLATSTNGIREAFGRVVYRIVGYAE